MGWSIFLGGRRKALGFLTHSTDEAKRKAPAGGRGGGNILWMTGNASSGFTTTPKITAD